MINRILFSLHVAEVRLGWMRQSRDSHWPHHCAAPESDTAGLLVTATIDPAESMSRNRLRQPGFGTGHGPGPAGPRLESLPKPPATPSRVLRSNCSGAAVKSIVMMSVNENADVVVEALRGEIIKFHQLSNGSIEAITGLFSELAKTPLPPPVICDLLGLTKDEVKAKFEAGSPPTATEDQLINALRKSVDPQDTPANYSTILAKHIQRLENARIVMATLGEKLKQFHSKVRGDVAKIGALFSDLTPEPQRGQPLPPGMINALLRVEPKATSCSVEKFLSCFQRNLDLNDTVEVIRPVLDRHISTE